jgi:hypothetical protein
MWTVLLACCRLVVAGMMLFSDSSSFVLLPFHPNARKSNEDINEMCEMEKS